MSRRHIVDAHPLTIAQVEWDIQDAEITERLHASTLRESALRFGWESFEARFLDYDREFSVVKRVQNGNFSDRRRISTNYESRAILLENYAEYVVENLAIKAVRFLNASHAAQCVASRNRPRTVTMSDPDIMSVPESISRMDSSLLRAIMYMAAECDPITGVPLSQVAQAEWLKGFQ